MSNQKPPAPPSWSEFFALDATTDVPADFMSEADRNQYGTLFADQVARGLAEADAQRSQLVPKPGGEQE